MNSIWCSRYAVATASHPGREHLRLLGNNQDALALRASEEALVAVVTDGCSMGRRSEVGATLGAQFIAGWLLEHGRAETLEDARRVGAELGLAVDGFLTQLLRSLGEAGDRRARLTLIAELLLFTFLAARVDAERTLLVGLGDGYFHVGETATALAPGAGNAPPYAAYRLLDPGELEGAELPREVELHAFQPTPTALPLILGTDGAAEIAAELPAWLADPALPTNPHQLGRHLRQCASRRRGLADDTTLAIVLPRGG
jgi:hypothetical protein